MPVKIKNPTLNSHTWTPIEYYYSMVPCGNCDECFKARQQMWWIRLKHELKSATTAHFITLTYNDEHLRRSDNNLLTCDKADLQHYFKRLRKREAGNTAIKYYACSEYGEHTQRPHYHAIIFNTRIEANFSRAWRLNEQPIGLVHVGTVTDASIRYVTGYMGKRQTLYGDDYDDRLPEFSLMSKGLGLQQFMQHADYYQDRLQSHIVIDGLTYPLPRYYKQKLFNKTQLKQIGNENLLIKAKSEAKNQANYATLNDYEQAQWQLSAINNQHNKRLAGIRKLKTIKN